LVVKNPQHYIDGQPTKLKRWLMERNYKIFGTGIGISGNGLKYNYDELKLLVEKTFKEYKYEHHD